LVLLLSCSEAVGDGFRSSLNLLSTNLSSHISLNNVPSEDDRLIPRLWPLIPPSVSSKLFFEDFLLWSIVAQISFHNLSITDLCMISSSSIPFPHHSLHTCNLLHISVLWNQRDALFIQFITNSGPLHVSSITCSSSRGAAAQMRACYISWLHQDLILVQPADITRTPYTKYCLCITSWGWASNAQNMWRPLILNKLN
jgi:hypothetical protein